MKRLVVRNLKFHAIGPVNLEVAKSECIGICGPSGAGKSLFLRALADMDPCEEGQLFLDGVAASDMSAPEWRQKVGLLPAESAWWHDTVGEHFNRIDENFFNELGFDRTVLHWEIRRLSSGERQRLSLLRLLAGRPPVLLLDEPTANLDAGSIDKVERLITAYRRNEEAAVIWVSHDLKQLARVSPRYFMVKDHRMTAYPLSSIRQ